MKILLDTHILLALLKGNLDSRYPAISEIMRGPAAQTFVSVASFWEIAIKTRLGKLDPGMPLERIAGFCDISRLDILQINVTHAITAASPVPRTRDPFDRLLLAQC